MTPRQSEEALYAQLSDPRLRELTECALDLLAVTDADLILRYVSPATERVLGYGLDELRGVLGLDLVHADDLARTQQAAAELLAAPEATVRFEVRVRRKDGDYRRLDLVGYNLLGNPAIGALLVSARDVTEQHQLLAALTEREHRFRMLAENARDVVARYRLLPSPEIEYISPSVERITGYSPAELYADPLAYQRMIAPEDRERLTRLVSGNARDELSRPQTLCWIRKDGARVWMEQLTVLLYDGHGQLAAAECSCRDVTEKVALEAQLRQAQKLEAIGTLAAGMAHDLNNLLMTMFAHIGRIETRLQEDATGSDSLRELKAAGRRAALLTEELLAFARKGVRMAEVVDLHRCIAQDEAMLRALLPAEVALELELAAAQTRVRVDRGQLDQVLRNLTINARDAMPEGGRIALRTADAGPGRIMLSVQDSGAGIAPADLQRVFEPFFTIKQGSGASGLGLAVVYGIVRRFGGSIVVQSPAGEGARFVIELPTTEEALPAILPERADALATHAGSGETVLLVEDQRPVREVLAQVLRDAGYRVLQAESGEAALSAVHGQPIDALITDMVMLDMSGAELVEKLRDAQPALPALCMSGYAGDQVDVRTTPDARTVFLAKPFLPDEMLAALGRLLA